MNKPVESQDLVSQQSNPMAEYYRKLHQDYAGTPMAEYYESLENYYAGLQPAKGVSKPETSLQNKPSAEITTSRIEEYASGDSEASIEEEYPSSNPVKEDVTESLPSSNKTTSPALESPAEFTSSNTTASVLSPSDGSD